jgi:hypothetical protein
VLPLQQHQLMACTVFGVLECRCGFVSVQLFPHGIKGMLQSVGRSVFLLFFICCSWLVGSAIVQPCASMYLMMCKLASSCLPPFGVLWSLEVFA